MNLLFCKTSHKAIFYFVLLFFLNMSCKQNKLDVMHESDENYNYTGIMRNGKKEGFWYKLNKDGDTLGYLTFKKGVLDGPFMDSYDDGIVKEIGIMKNNKVDKYIIRFHANGSIDTYTTHNTGKKVETVYSYYRSGILNQKTELMNGAFDHYIHFYDSGRVRNSGNANGIDTLFVYNIDGTISLKILTEYGMPLDTLFYRD